METKRLVFVEGISYCNHMEGVPSLPIHFKIPNRLVYSPHSYGINLKYDDYEDMRTSTDLRFGFLLKMQPEVPVWVGEFGSCQVGDCPAWDHAWEGWWMRWCKEHGVKSIGFWALDSIQSTATGRTFGVRPRH